MEDERRCFGKLFQMTGATTPKLSFKFQLNAYEKNKKNFNK